MSRKILVSGAAGNTGRAVVNCLLNSGHHVFGITRAGQSLSEFDQNQNFNHLELDVTQPMEAKKCLENIEKEGHQVDVAALLVGGFAMGNISNTGEKQLKEMFSLNFESAYYLAREIFMHMDRFGKAGQLIFIGARSALEPQAGKDTLAYSLSKSLLFQLAELLNAEGKAKGIRSTILVPSILDTAPNRTAMPEADFDSWVKPEALGEIVNFITSSKADILQETVLKTYNRA
ncbi:SDR family NAD(P)-dependent oxidoreductase [Xanthovirga aplysinae]|uniref:SDR family NAD(P)-dependent oxidoreductase n=1 Tax=Xanthovirga aplysinae TaxID=2529853 RepID=UPI0012BC9995|nr:SDR family NAD(P)-dependent oxidoreductase [Xanthovirga aplysinae]MTI29598.1 SDR family NAD(P)-dependent oxidoreductase [Xanthovirga aplysinae]